MRTTVGELKSIIREAVESQEAAQELVQLADLTPEEQAALKQKMEDQVSEGSDDGDILDRAVEKVARAWRSLTPGQQRAIKLGGAGILGSLPFVSGGVVPGEALAIAALGAGITLTGKKEEKPARRSTSPAPAGKFTKTLGPSDGPWKSGTR